MQWPGRPVCCWPQHVWGRGIAVISIAYLQRTAELWHLFWLARQRGHMRMCRCKFPLPYLRFCMHVASPCSGSAALQGSDRQAEAQLHCREVTGKQKRTPAAWQRWPGHPEGSSHPQTPPQPQAPPCRVACAQTGYRASTRALHAGCVRTCAALGRSPGSRAAPPWAARPAQAPCAAPATPPVPWPACMADSQLQQRRLTPQLG